MKVDSDAPPDSQTIVYSHTKIICSNFDGIPIHNRDALVLALHFRFGQAVSGFSITYLDSEKVAIFLEFDHFNLRKLEATCRQAEYAHRLFPQLGVIICPADISDYPIRCKPWPSTVEK